MPKLPPDPDESQFDPEEGEPAYEFDESAGDNDDPYAPELNLIPGVGASFAAVSKPVREGKPNSDTYFQIRPEPEYTRDHYILIFRENDEKERYAIAPSLRHLVPDHVYLHRVVIGVNLHGTEFVWAVRLYEQTPEIKKGFSGESWSASAFEHIETAKKMWVKLKGDTGAGEYICTPANGTLHAPQWSGRSHKELLERAFKEKTIREADHPVIKRIHGEA